MIISKTPYRISLFGGGTDYPNWYLKNNGQVLSFSINKYVYISCRYLPNFFPHNFRILYAKDEKVNKINEITHPSVRETLKHINFKENLEIHGNPNVLTKDAPTSSLSQAPTAHTTLVAVKKMPKKYKKLKSLLYDFSHF